MHKTEWFQREFPPIKDSGLFPCILERLEGTGVRLKSKIAKIKGGLTLSQHGKWSINKEVGHLIDLELRKVGYPPKIRNAHEIN